MKKFLRTVNKRLTIAIDINDVIRDFTGQFIKYYQKGIDPNFEIEYDDVVDFNFMNVFPFKDENGNDDLDYYNQFKYEDYAFELYGRADVMERKLPASFNLWIQNTLRDFDDEKNPDVIIVSPFEANLTIQATLAFLSRIGVRVRNIYFPLDSQTIWDKCDILITANPNLLQNKPEGKISFKIEAPYNNDVEADYTFGSLCDIITDEEETLNKIIEMEN